ncbi:DUF2889 domain-containing protein [Herminiimonas sp. CN]|uniref:DUF2889 domain-containing protein n=1 Tax=Herminiimonas sp. CN TaxID=1349818 RepID=UPI000473F968|nr:DUF2889 domain-containing protein [Herminiimonas sp. CN]
MPLSLPVVQRTRKHTRTIKIEAFAREDGLWDIDACIADIKTRDIQLASGVHPANTPIHELWLRLTIDTQFNIIEVETASDAVPYPGYCDTIGPDYRKMVGLNLRSGFRHQLKQLLSGTHGCTHLTELAQILPTAAFQAFAGEALNDSDDDLQNQKPFELDRCHALRTDGAAVAKYYPRWARTPPADISGNPAS